MDIQVGLDLFHNPDHMSTHNLKGSRVSINSSRIRLVSF